MLGEHDLFGHEFNVYDPLVNVPLLVKHPEMEPGHDETTQVELLDLYHTILDATGVDPIGKSLDDRRSLLSPAYRDVGADATPGVDPGETAFVEYHRPVVELNQLESIAADAGIALDRESRWYSRMRAARRPDAKVISNEHIDDEAYRLDRDPGETENVAGDGDDAVAAVETALAEFETAFSDGWEVTGDADDPLEDMDEETVDRLRDLGYVE